MNPRKPTCPRRLPQRMAPPLRGVPPCLSAGDLGRAAPIVSSGPAAMPVYSLVPRASALCPLVRLGRGASSAPLSSGDCELGSDFTRWPTVKHSTSWLGLCPNWKKTGGKVKSSRTRRGKGRAAHALRLAAWCLMRSKGALGAYLRRQRSRLGAPKAITAAAHELARIVYHLMRHGEAYMKQTEQEYAEQVRQRLERQLARRAKEMGYELRRIEAPPPAAPTGG